MGTASLSIIATALSGCLAPGAATPTTEEPEAALPSSLYVDLHEYVLNITMPEGRPTILVALNVTKDMWVRPMPGVSDVARAPAEAPTYWTLCPWVRSFGIEDPFGYRVATFWLDGAELVPATRFIVRFSFAADDASGGHCVTDVTADRPNEGIRAHEPIDATLVLLVHPFEDLEDHERAAASSAIPSAFSMLVGIGARCTNDASKMCPGAQEAPAEPALRGGPTLSALCISFAAERERCQDAGFEVVDERAGQGPLAKGALTMRRKTLDQPGITLLIGSALSGAYRGFAGASAGTPGRASLEAMLDEAGTRQAVGCETFLVAQARVLAAHDTVAETTVRVRVEGDFDAVAFLWDIPMDLDRVSWSVQPAARAYEESRLFTNGALPIGRCS